MHKRSTMVIIALVLASVLMSGCIFNLGTNDEKAINKTLDQYETAVLKEDVQALVDLMVIEEPMTKKTLTETFAEQFAEIKYETYKFTDRIITLNKEEAVVEAQATLKMYLKSEPNETMEFPPSDVIIELRQVNSNWKIVTIDNPDEI